MEFIEECITCIGSEWRSKVRSLLVPDCLVHPLCWDDTNFVGYGVVTGVSQLVEGAHDIWMCNAVINKPLDGLAEVPDVSFEFWAPKGCVNLSLGSWFGFQNVQVVKQDEKMQIFSNRKSVLWIISEHSPSLPCYFCHAFAGGFAGWERAVKWMDCMKHIVCAGSISIDFDFEAVQTWRQCFGGKVCSSDFEIQPPHDQHFCILSDVTNPQWYNTLKFDINLVMTISPPCQPWSRGGLSTGVESENGLTFLQIILAIRLVRPIVVPTECADSTPRHQQYKVLKLAFRLAGYVCAWSTISSYEDLSMNVRTRWLAIWVRHDAVVNSPHDGVKLRDVNRIPWNHVHYDFPIPGQIQHQLSLSRDLLGIYGDSTFLPEVKRRALTDLSQTAVLKARCIESDQCLPTLCASYTRQHELSRNHLSKKGIFGCLIQHKMQFFFVDPLRFAALFGATIHAIVALPIKCEIAFHLLGNAVTVPQALLALCHGLHIAGFTIPPIETCVEKCWNDRLTTKNAMVLRNADFVFLVPFALLTEVIPRCIHLETHPDCKCSFGGFDFWCNPRCSIRDLLACIGFEDDEIRQFDLFEGLESIDLADRITDHCNTSIRLCKFGVEVVFVRFTCHGHEISPTVPYAIEDEASRNGSILGSSAQHDHDLKPPTALVACWGFCPLLSQPLDELDLAISRHLANLQTCQHVHDHIRIRIFLVGHSTGDLFVPGYLLENFDFQSDESKLRALIEHWIRQDVISHDQSIGIFPTASKIKGCLCSYVVVPYHHRTDEAFVIVQCDEDDYQLVAFPMHCRLAHPLKKHKRDFNVVMHNGNRVDAFAFTHVNDGDVLFCFHESKHEHVSHRVNLMFQNGPKLASDELQAITKWINENGSGGIVHNFIHWNSQLRSLCMKIVGAIDHGLSSTIAHCFPILFDDHWGALEVCAGLKIANAFNIPKEAQPFLRDTCLRALAPLYAYNGLSFFVHPTWAGMCGWVVISRWIGNFNVPIPDFNHSIDFDASIAFSTIDSQNFSIVIERSIALRKWFFSCCDPNHECQTILFGGVQQDDDVSMQAPQAGDSQKKDLVDPWIRYDPWLVSQKQCRWEDLHLPDDHPFWCSAKRIVQVHRTQISAKLGGIAFATKAMVKEVFATKPPHETALIVPVGDKNSFDPSLKITGPFEVIVKDNAVGTMYKRQIVLVQSHDLVTFQLPKATYTSTLTVLREVVLECDERLISKDLVATILRSPLDAFRAKAVEQFPTAATKGLNVYAFRVIPVQQKGSNHRIFQAMCKLSETHRVSFLELSGIADLFARDFIPKGDSPQDHITIPKFWLPDKANKDDALRMASTLEGFAGLVLTKRGLAVRGWNSKVASLRRVLQSQDERINDDNIAVIPNVQLEATGWPASISPSEVIRATKHALDLPPLLFRCYKNRGVTSWSLGFDRRPAKLTFVANFNGTDCEILLAEPTQNSNPEPKPKKGSGKAAGKGSSVPVRTSKQENIQQQDANSQRLTTLEGKFAQMERRQDNLESRISSGFDSVNDQLRQVLNVIQPRSHTGNSSGFTPPPKAPRTT